MHVYAWDVCYREFQAVYCRSTGAAFAPARRLWITPPSSGGAVDQHGPVCYLQPVLRVAANVALPAPHMASLCSG